MDARRFSAGLGRIMLRAQPLLTVVLPLWFFFGGGLQAPEGWQVVVLAFGAPFLAVALIALLVLVLVRPGRPRGRVDGVDAALFLVVDVLVIVASTFGAVDWPRAVLLVIGLVVTLWIAIARLMTAGRRSLDDLAGSWRARTEITAEPVDGGEYTVIEIDEDADDAPEGDRRR
ncbi:hypothetical protein [Pseudoclavibacter caeni]|jgi:hypothetical protein|uniref:Uncharacterized protein n=1 Tax=Pseudoclavibacter caeni TaxID=908846 RepID=A0A7C8FK81_9MICO|nr:hypothetical protein [Pseudoclavibacter caeni]KAB1631934.1 hypothetical protein F8O02_06310 [Pseudoclavibacter caeni]NYJ96870.1 hypothetical protein [Pseudoclavibacter caeni]